VDIEFLLQQSTNGIVLGSVYALFALGFSLVLANLRIFHVAHEGVFTWGAVFAWYLMDQLSWPFLLAVPAVVVLSGTLNVILYAVLIRHIERRANRELAGFISSLGGLIILVELAEIVLDRKAVRLPFKAFPIEVWDLGPIQISSVQLLMVAAAAVCFIGLQWLIEFTETGREIKAVAFDRELASLLGVRVDRVSAIVFFVSGALGGLVAILVAIAFNVINSGLGATYLVLAIAVTVIGGFGSVKGAFLAGIIVGLLSAYTTAYITSSFREVVVFGLLMLFLTVRPTGIFSVRDAAGRA
jgi:branched-chain amino acid transport system permease protein